MKRIPFMSFVFGLLGIASWIFCAWHYLEGQNFKAHALTTEGTVVENVARTVDSSGDIHGHSPSGTTYAPHVRFTTRDGVEVDFTSTISSNPPQFAPGDSVRVLYLPNAPLQAEVEGAETDWLLMLMAVGAAMILVAFAMPMVGRRLAGRVRGNGHEPRRNPRGALAQLAPWWVASALIVAWSYYTIGQMRAPNTARAPATSSAPVARATSLAPARAEHSGVMDQAVLLHTIARHRNELRFCYAQQAAPAATGDAGVTVEFVIDETGSVSSSRVTDKRPEREKLERCIGSAVRRWRFPAPTGGSVQVEHTFGSPK